MKKAISMILLILCAHKLESCANEHQSIRSKEEKTSSQKFEQKIKNNSQKIINRAKEEGCLLCCSKTDCVKMFK